MTIRDFEEALFNQWKSTIGDPFIPDGVVDSKSYLDSRQKVLYVLKEANDYEEDLRCFVRSGAKGVTWNNLARWAKGIQELPNTLDWGDVDRITQNQRIEMLKPIAFMNLNKQGGGGRANWEKLKGIVERDQVFIQRQIQLYGTDYVICCGTGDLLTLIPPYSEWGNDWLCTGQMVHYVQIPGGGWLIDFWHPQARKKKRDLYDLMIETIRFIERKHGPRKTDCF